MNDLEGQIDHNYTGDDPIAMSHAPLPAGWYLALIEQADTHENSRQCGLLLKLKLAITSSAGGKRVVWENINIRHDESREAQEIGQKRVNRIRKLLGISELKNSQQLVGHQIGVDLIVKKDQRGEDNKVQDYCMASELASKGVSAVSTAPSQGPGHPQQANHAHTGAQMAPPTGQFCPRRTRHATTGRPGATAWTAVPWRDSAPSTGRTCTAVPGRDGPATARWQPLAATRSGTAQ